MFEQATRLKLRWITSRGVVGVEDLWDLSLSTLDVIAVALHKQLNETSISFVKPAGTDDSGLQLRFDVIKHIIDVKVKDRDESLVARDRAAKKQQLLEILARKQTSELETKTTEELTNMINSL